jgi:hypothetical protein
VENRALAALLPRHLLQLGLLLNKLPRASFVGIGFSTKKTFIVFDIEPDDVLAVVYSAWRR